MVGLDRRFVEGTAEASKSAAFGDEKVAGMYLRAGIQGGRAARNACFLVEGSASRFE